MSTHWIFKIASITSPVAEVKLTKLQFSLSLDFYLNNGLTLATFLSFRNSHVLNDHAKVLLKIHSVFF